MEHPEFVKLIRHAASRYSPPSRHDVGGKLLDKEQGSLMNTCRQTLENKTVSLSLDGGAMFTTNRLCASVSQLIKEIHF